MATPALPSLYHFVPYGSGSYALLPFGSPPTLRLYHFVPYGSGRGPPAHTWGWGPPSSGTATAPATLRFGPVRLLPFGRGGAPAHTMGWGPRVPTALVPCDSLPYGPFLPSTLRLLYHFVPSGWGLGAPAHSMG